MKKSASEIARQAIELFLLYRDGYGHDEDSAMNETIKEIAEAEHVAVVERLEEE